MNKGIEAVKAVLADPDAFSGTHDRGGRLYLSFGATAKPDDKGTEPEFLIGGSTSVARGWIFLTLGTYIGRQQSLEGGLTEGARVPADLATLPIRKSVTARLGFAISIKLR